MQKTHFCTFWPRDASFIVSRIFAISAPMRTISDAKSDAHSVRTLYRKIQICLMQGGMKDRVKEGGVLVIYLYTCICKIVKKNSTGGNSPDNYTCRKDNIMYR